MALASKKLKIEASKMETEPFLEEESDTIGIDDKDHLFDAKQIAFDPKPVSLPFKKTLYAVTSNDRLEKNLEEDQGADEKTFDRAEARRLALKSALPTALTYGIPVALVCFLLGIRIGMACMNSTHGSTLEILWEALKF